MDKTKLIYEQIMNESVFNVGVFFRWGENFENIKDVMIKIKETRLIPVRTEAVGIRTRN